MLCHRGSGCRRLTLEPRPRDLPALDRDLVSVLEKGVEEQAWIFAPCQFSGMDFRSENNPEARDHESIRRSRLGESVRWSRIPDLRQGSRTKKLRQSNCSTHAARKSCAFLPRSCPTKTRNRTVEQRRQSFFGEVVTLLLSPPTIQTLTPPERVFGITSEKRSDDQRNTPGGVSGHSHPSSTRNQRAADLQFARFRPST